MSALAFLALLAVSAAARGPSLLPTIYGKDDRLELYEVSDTRLRELSRAVAALATKDRVTIRDGRAHLFTTPYGPSLNLDPETRFYGQPDLNACTASLIAPDLALTAGHCMEDESDCRAAMFVFDYAYPTKGADPTVVPAESVAGCAAIEAGALDEAGWSSPAEDWAVVRLDRRMDGRPILELADGPPPEPGATLHMIGYPMGLPQKLATGKAREMNEDGFLSAELDAFAGNSGSPVLDARYRIVGVLASGGNDFRRKRPRDLAGAIRWLTSKKARQKVEVVVPEGGEQTESLQPISAIRERINALREQPALQPDAARALQDTGR